MPRAARILSFQKIEQAGIAWRRAQANYIDLRLEFDRTRFNNRLSEERAKMKMKLAQAAAKAAMNDYYATLNELWGYLKNPG